MKTTLGCWTRAIALSFFALSLPALAAGPVQGLRVPPGFRIAVWAENVPDARSLALGERGTVFVGSRRGDRVRALVDTDGDGAADRRYEIGAGLTAPNGVAFHEGALYVAERHRILRYHDIESRLASPPQPRIVRDDLPTASHHGARYIGFGPDGKLYLAIGAPCNVCEAETFGIDDGALEFASITRMNADGSGWQVVARGVRNSVGFDWHPDTGVLWFTDNGRDWLGDDQPSDELNRLTAVGQHFGFPYCHEGRIADPEFGKGHACEEYVPPVLRLGPHVAALGLVIYDGTGEHAFPPAFRHAALIALHGSWNRSKKIGYQVVAAEDLDKEPRLRPLVEGWLDGEEVSGRPVDLLVMPDGAVLISDDRGGRIYRLSHARPPSSLPAASLAD